MEELEEKLSKAAGALRLTVLGFRAVGNVVSLMVLKLAHANFEQMCYWHSTNKCASICPQK